MNEDRQASNTGAQVFVRLLTVSWISTLPPGLKRLWNRCRNVFLHLPHCWFGIDYIIDILNVPVGGKMTHGSFPLDKKHTVFDMLKNNLVRRLKSWIPAGTKQ